MIETKKKERIEDRLVLKKELTDFIIDNFQGKDFGRETILAIIDFVVNVMILPPKLEEDYQQYYIGNYKKIESMYILTDRAADWADAIIQQILKKPYLTVVHELEKIEQYKADKIKAEKAAEAAKIAKLEAEKAAKLEVAKVAKNNTILSLLFKKNMSVNEIEELFGYGKVYIKNIIKENHKKQ